MGVIRRFQAANREFTAALSLRCQALAKAGNVYRIRGHAIGTDEVDYWDRFGANAIGATPEGRLRAG